MKVDVLVAEIGSTTTAVNAFTGLNSANPALIGQGVAPTSVEAGDVTVGLKEAVSDLKDQLDIDELSWDHMFASSSAAGGLSMTVHGLVYDMTVRAAKEAALGSGAVLRHVTAGKLRRTDIAKVKEIAPNIILVAGGVDYGERDTALYNFEMLAREVPGIPIIYAGNIENHDEIRLIAEELGTEVFYVENCYPCIDQLNIEPTRIIIQDVFEKHIIHSPGMEKIHEMVDGTIMPTPGAVMQAAKMANEKFGDLIVFDVGGATTDLHSVTEGSPAIQMILMAPEPFAKRTVEGDLGVYVSRKNILDQISERELEECFPDKEYYLEHASEIPTEQGEIEFVERLTEFCCRLALKRHAGIMTELYTAHGRKVTAIGKDLTAVKTIIGTGGALTRLPHSVEILERLRVREVIKELYPTTEAVVKIDHYYIMASLGVLSTQFPEAAILLLQQSMDVKN
ncbi:MAG TPA: DNA mismatch repair protein MutL [Clostridiaceae bacterium]|nr:DNA mismatch repair protein MutL [Clostridiaceae bacterium]